MADRGWISSTNFSVDSISVTTLNATTVNATTTINFPNLTANRVVTTDGSSNLVAASVTASEIAFLSGLSSNAQTQLGTKLSTSGGTLTGALVLDNQVGLDFRELTANGTNRARIQAPASLAADYTLTLPADDGAANQVLTTDGSGVLSWTTPSGTISGSGAANQIAYWSSSSAITSESDLYWDSTNNRLGIKNASPSTTLDVISTTAQARLGYDSTNYIEFSVGSTGNCSINSTSSAGTGGSITWNAASGSIPGTVTLNAGTSTSGGNTGGAFTFGSGSGNGAAAGGVTSVLAGAGGATGPGGSILIKSGSGGSTSGDAGNVEIRSGDITSGSLGNVLLSSTGGNVIVGGGTAASELRILEASGSGTNYSAFKAQAQSANLTYTLPATQATANHVLKNNGSGTLSWATPLSGITREVFFEMPNPVSSYGNYSVQNVGSSSTIRLNFICPVDYVSLVSLELIVSPTSGAAQTSRNIDLFSSYGAVGEPSTQHSQSNTTTLYNLSGTTDRWTAISASSVFTNLAAGDMCGLQVQQLSVGGTVRYLGIRLRYLA